ncbi:MAG: hypothetical protein WA728_32895 [Xanthobacteraceae bacterium]
MMNTDGSRTREICECYRHAEDCALKATAHTDAQQKQCFLDLEQRWLFLARSYEFSERLTNLSSETKRQVDNEAPQIAANIAKLPDLLRKV